MSTDKVHDYHQAHHFESVESEYSASKQGIWLFMVTEILMFGGLFVGYAIMKSLHPEAFRWGASQLHWTYGCLNTVVLLISSFTMALAIRMFRVNEQAKAKLCLLITILCGALFMGIKILFEWMPKYELGLIPFKLAGSNIKEVAGYVENSEMFFGFYYIMTGVHGAHVLIGMGLIFWVWLRSLRGDFGPKHWTAVEGVGIFWHLVDLIWIYLFPMFYLIQGLH